MQSNTAESMDPRGEQSQEEVGRRELESIAHTFNTLKRLFSENLQLKGERDNFERQAAVALNENEMLRNQIRQVKGERDHFSRAYSMLSAQLDTIGSSLVNAVKMSRVQAYGERSAASPERKLTGDQPQQPAEPSIPKFLTQSPEEFHRGSVGQRDVPGKKVPPISLEALADQLGGYIDSLK
jgi:hypothetical protein